MQIIDSPSEHPSRWTGLRTRIISAVVLAAVALAVLWVGGWIFTLFIIAAGLLGMREWDTLTAADGNGWKLLGVAYVAIPCASLVWLRDLHFEGVAHGGASLVLYVLLTVWATDIGAYFAGRRIGGAKLAPTISPGKTWAGLAGGIIAAAIVGGFSTYFSPFPPSFIAGVDMGVVIALLSQLGDLFESWMKRRAGVKDSGTLIPGHGGLLDRIDGLMFTLPLFAWLVYYSGPAL